MPALNSLLLSRAARLLLVLLLLALSTLPLASLSYNSSISQSAPGELPAMQVISAGDAQVGEAEKPAVEGWVTDRSSGQAIRDAIVTLDGVAEAISDESGYFSFALAQIATDQHATSDNGQPVTLSVSEGSHAPWSIHDAIFYPGDTLRIYPRLDTAEAAPTDLVAYKRQALAAAFSFAHGMEAASPDEVFADNALAAPSLAPPATIRVYRTATGVVEVVPFRDYVKHVLPSEWIPTWSADALKAGAMAVKSYAWYWVRQGGKQVALGADVKDNVDDQVYDPNLSYASTDAAVDATFNYAMTRNGVLFQAQYCAGSYGPDPSGDCPWSNQYMTQWGSAYYGDAGKPWGWILQFYYRGATITPNPPGGGYDGAPVPTAAPQPQPTRPSQPPAPPAPASSNFTVGQGATKPEIFQEAYERNGGAQVLGRPTSAVRWWLPYVTEHNVVAQAFSGSQGGGRLWLVYDVLKSTDETGHAAYMLSGEIAAAYADHTPPGPEWVGAPTSDTFTGGAELGGLPAQGFRKGLLSGSGQSVQFTPWPETFGAWKAEYFPRHDVFSPQAAPARTLRGWPALVREVVSPNFDWSAEARVPESLGMGAREWSVQFTRNFEIAGGSYDFTLAADSGVRLWVDGLLAVDGWHWDGLHTESYNIDLATGTHNVRIQYFSLDSAARLEFNMAPRGASPTPAPTIQAPPPEKKAGNATLRVSVRWLGRQSAPSDSWVQPITLSLSDPASASIVGKYQSTTDHNGVAFFQGLPVGTYNVHVKGPHSLQSARASIVLSNNTTAEADMKAQIEGDVDGDNCVTVADFSVVQAMLGANKNTPGFNSAADLNNDGEVTLSDVSLLRSGFDMCGDISADGQFSAMSTNLAPSLAPWLNPERLPRTLQMSLQTSGASVKPGGIVEVNIVAEAGAQPIDGASFVLHFDSAMLMPVDAAGFSAKAVEPGVELPSVMGNWVDAQGGAIGYSAGVLQGEPPQGSIVVAKVRFRVVGNQATTTRITFDPAPSSYMQMTNGGVNLLAKANDLTVSISR
ncbi:MAG TPA: SpoIID/LytB domain-containing protein [Chloroflexia bacterium]